MRERERARENDKRLSEGAIEREKGGGEREGEAGKQASTPASFMPQCTAHIPACSPFNNWAKKCQRG